MLRKYLSFSALFLALIITACTHDSDEANAKRYQLEGRVVAVDAAQHQLSVANKNIPGVMEPMTMPYLVGKDDLWVFGKIAPGDTIHATLVMGKDAELQQINFTKTSQPSGSTGATKVHIPQPGEQVPDFALVNQNGQKISFNQFRGKPVLLTFIYTRCPFPEFCPRMSGNFAEILKDLEKTPGGLNGAQLLSISIDPERDTPAVLRKYGEGYSGRTDPGFKHWQFATGSPGEIRKAADFFGLTYSDSGGQITHGVVTALIDKDGKVLKVYFGNDWKPDDVAADLATAAAAHSS